MRTQFITIVLSCALLWCAGCKESFDPKGSFEQKLVVYSILSNVGAAQFVRVYSTYDVQGYNPLAQTSDAPVSDAQVHVTGGGTDVAFKDTLVQRSDTSRYRGPIEAYVAHNLDVQSNQMYVLTVNSPTHGSATATTTVPSPGLVQSPDVFILTKPLDHSQENLSVSLLLSSIAKGIVTRFYVDFRVTVLNNRVFRMEVPLRIVHSTDSQTGAEIVNPVYYELVRAADSSPFSTGLQSVEYSVEAYTYALRQIATTYGSDHVQFLDAVFYLYQVDANLYNYYNIANGFQDRYTIRTDEPDYTNIQNGVGVFGSMRVDSTTVSLPATIPF